METFGLKEAISSAEMLGYDQESQTIVLDHKFSFNSQFAPSLLIK